MPSIDAWDYLTTDEKTQITEIMLEACARNDKYFDVYELVLKIVS